MLKPSQYIAAAVRGIRDRLMDDCAMTLTRGDVTAKVTRASASLRGETGAGDFGPTEIIRVIAVASDLYEGIDKGDSVCLDETERFVTSVRADAAQASLYIGMSDAMRPISFHLIRSEGMTENITAMAVIVKTSDGDFFDGSASAKPNLRVVTAYIRAKDLIGASIQSGDRFVRENGEKFAIESVDRTDDNYISARARVC